MFIIDPIKNLPELIAETTNSGRFYVTPNGVKLNSVTTVLGAKAKEAIAAWRKKVGEEEANRIMKHASERGTAMHELCEKYLLNERITWNSTNNLLAFDMFKTIKPHLNKIGLIHCLETALYSERLGLAGRTDCIGYYDKTLSVIDFKTATKPKREEHILSYFCQCTSYGIMVKEQLNIRPTQAVIIMAVENAPPEIFIRPLVNYVKPLMEYIEYFNNHK